MFETVLTRRATPFAGDPRSEELLTGIRRQEVEVRDLQARQIQQIAAYAARQRDLFSGDSPTVGQSSTTSDRHPQDDDELCERAIALEVAAATGLSAASARMLVGDADALTGHHLAVLDALRTGRINLWVARQITSGTRVLDAEQAASIDVELAEEAAQLLPGQVRAMVDTRVNAVDPEAAARRAALARADKDVYLVHRPDSVAMLRATLPAEQAMACYEALDDYARARRADGDARSIAHLMCDTLVERITGASTATDPCAVELQVVLTDATLLGRDDQPAELVGYGSIPAEIARALGVSSGAWLRRLLSDPFDATVVTVDTRRRRFDGPLRDLILIRDRRCRNPVCNAKIRDVDHRHDSALGGPTSATNGDGYCQRCHHLKDHPAISVRRHRGHEPPDVDSGPQSNAHAIVWTGPSGRSSVSLAPPALGHGTLTRRQLAYRRALVEV